MITNVLKATQCFYLQRLAGQQITPKLTETFKFNLWYKLYNNNIRLKTSFGIYIIWYLWSLIKNISIFQKFYFLHIVSLLFNCVSNYFWNKMLINKLRSFVIKITFVRFGVDVWLVFCKEQSSWCKDTKYIHQEPGI